MAKLLTAAELQELLTKADENTDFKKLLESAVKALTAAENKAGQVEEVNEKLAEAIAERDIALDQIKELGEKLDIQERNQNTEGTLVEVDGKHYILHGNTFFIKKEGKRVEMNAEQLAKDTEALLHLVTIGSGALQLAK